jgi:asparagine synthase (glutamine-hydrolysing)
LAHLTEMLSAQLHRGHQHVSWVYGAVALGQQTHCTTSDQPAHHEPVTPTHTAIGYARIDNRQTLYSTLANSQLTSTSQHDQSADIKLILTAYARWGVECVHHLEGDFAFALWDGTQLFCARDKMGVVPFYYVHQNVQDPLFFAFASEIPALLAHPNVVRTPDDQSIGYYLANTKPFGGDLTRTFYRHIRRLPPHHCLTVRFDGGTPQIRMWSYWDYDTTNELRLKSDGEYAEAFYDVLKSAVETRLDTTKHVGFALSGGLDSSSIYRFARVLQPDSPFHAIHITSELPECDEQPYLNAVLHPQDRERLHLIPYASPMHNLADLVRQVAHPLRQPNPPNTVAIYRTAVADGVGVLLDGVEGDLAVSYGRMYLTELARAGHWGKATREARLLAQRFGGNAANYLRRFTFHHLRRQVQNRRLADLLSALPAMPYLLPAFADRIRAHRRANTESIVNPAIQLDPVSMPNAQTERQWHYETLNAGYLVSEFEELDVLAAHEGIEVRHPFAAVNLIAFCLSLPAEQKLRDGWARYILRTGTEGVLPDAVRWRGGKSNFTPLYHRRLTVTDRAIVESLLTADLRACADYVAVQPFRRAVQRFLATPNTADAASIMRVYQLDAWLNTLS